MTDFDYDVRQKKQLVASARRRVNGSKSKKCSLPSDNLTPGQLAKLSGPCVSLKMNEPITYEAFKPLPDNLKREYLIGLRDRYRVSQRSVAKMMGTSNWTICTLYARLQIDATLPPVTAEKRMEYQALWDQFLAGKDTDAAEVIDEKTEDHTETKTDTDVLPEAYCPERTIKMNTELDIGYVENPSDLLMLLQRVPIPFPGYIRITISGEETV